MGWRGRTMVLTGVRDLRPGGRRAHPVTVALRLEAGIGFGLARPRARSSE